MLQAYINDGFENLLQYRDWIDLNMKRLSAGNDRLAKDFSRESINRKIRSPGWFGKNVSYEELVAGITQYKNPSLIEQVYNKVSDRISILSTSEIKSRKIKYNPFGLGVFSYDRAAMGMYRLKEYYCSALAATVDESQIISKDGGYLLAEGGLPVIRRWEQHADGRPKIRTSSKNVFAYYPRVNKEKQAVELFFCTGGHAGISAGQFLYSGICGIIIAEMLEKAKVPVRITIAIGSSPDRFERSAYCSLIPVKNYDEPLDVNLLATLTSDPRFFRYEGFKGIISGYNDFNASCPYDLGQGFSPANLKKTIEQSSYQGHAKYSPNRVYLGWIFNEEETILAINQTISVLAEKLND